MMDIFVIILLIISWIFIIFGMVSIFILKNVYTRILSAATIDTMGSLTIIIALLLSSITQYDYIIRFVLLIGFLLMTTPISSHVNIRSAYLTGVEVKHIYTDEQRKRLEEEEGEVHG